MLLAFLFLAISSVATFSAPLLMLPLESDADGNLSALWENSIMQVFKEAGFETQKIEQEHFAECQTIDCVISAARASGAGGLFRGRLRVEGKDSVSIRLRIDWLAGNSRPQTEIQRTVPIAWEEVLKSGIILKLLSGITGKNADVEYTGNRNTHISVETSPEYAVVMLNGNAICQSPCIFSDSGSTAQIAAYWSSGENLWAAKRTVRLSGDTAKVFLELRRSYTGTEIRTNPSNALVFSADVLNADSKPMGKTPYAMQSLPGEMQIRLFHEGYSDTLLNVKIDALDKHIQFVQLAPITDPQKIHEQNLLIKSQFKKKLGHGLLGGSVGPLAMGILLCVLAQDDYQKARDIKRELELPYIGGPNFKAKVKENNNAVNDGDLKRGFGIGLISLSVLLAGAGFSMSF
ncbi:MAG: hypothetical protein FWB90_05325 [Fibromonadales bacterium]|nr:hypothetical protein [Fibromonadales bacterium]